MSKRFSAQHMHNGYAAMGGAMRRPRYAGVDTGRSIAQSIAAERAKAVRMANAAMKKKKK